MQTGCEIVMSKKEFFKNHLIKYTWLPILSAIPVVFNIVQSDFRHLLQHILLSISDNLLLASLFYSLFVIIVGFYRYKVFIDDYYELDRILQSYTWDEDIGLYKHKEKEVHPKNEYLKKKGMEKLVDIV